MEGIGTSWTKRLYSMRGCRQHLLSVFDCNTKEQGVKNSQDIKGNMSLIAFGFRKELW